MEVSEHQISVVKTARYLQSGVISDSTTEIWILLHGYAQLAHDFLLAFRTIQNEHRVLIAPEGLNKFYAKGFGGKPAATWMTSEMRAAEIKDYIAYIDQVYEDARINGAKAKIILLGFSQGVATASRWLFSTTKRVDCFVLYAGEIAAELKDADLFNQKDVNLFYITGNTDKLISPDRLDEVKKWMNQAGAREITFNGGHEIHEDALRQLIVLV